MTPEDAQQLLGIDSSDPQAPQAPEIIEQAYQTRRAGLQHKRDQAPTEAMQAKLDQALAKLEVARNTLLATGSVPESSSGTSSQAPSRSSPLSGTKLADLPQADASRTGFDGGQAGAQLNLQAGTVLAGRYEIRERIGAGGMGAVYRALDKTTGKDIAVKVLLPGLMKNERARERFLDEARISQQLSHPNIVNVYDVQQDGDFFFLTMELLEGQDLRQVMDNRQLARQPFSQQEMQTLAGQLCDALAYAHKHTVHRDLKPENVWLTEDGDYKLMDFGIARVQSTSQRTQTGAAMGTAYYMAPEQLKGQKNIDGRADQYALGVMLYELATGEVPAGLIKPLRELRKDLSRGFANTVMRTLHTNPDERFADVSAFGQSLQSGKGGVELQWPWKSLGIAAGVLVAVLGLGGLAVSGGFGLDSLKGLLPMSAEEIATQKASLARFQGEIRMLKQRLESARRSLEVDVRDGDRNKAENFEALQHWRRLTEDSLFAGSRLTELAGELSMAEALLHDNAFVQAKSAFVRVREGYAELLQLFGAAGELYLSEQDFVRMETRWNTLEKADGLKDITSAVEALTHRDQALQQQREGDFLAALASWRKASEKLLQLTEVAEELYAAEQRFTQAESAWNTLKKGYGLNDTTSVAEALRLREQARDQQRQENFSAALASWREGAEHWDMARSAVRADIGRIDAERKAELLRRVEKLKQLLFDNEMVRIPGGSFTMGRDAQLYGGTYDFTPLRRVTIKPFAMSKYEVTFAQYDAFVEASGRARPSDEGWGRGSRPVINVSWEDARAYVNWLSGQTGKRLRLPTEAEWEYAAKAGYTGKYDPDVQCWEANYGREDFYSVEAACPGRGENTDPVGKHSANAFGLHDMLGNVQEWVQDCYHNSYNGAPTDGSAWERNACRERVLRGGAWGQASAKPSPTFRRRSSPDHNDRYTGFRLAQDL